MLLRAKYLQSGSDGCGDSTRMSSINGYYAKEMEHLVNILKDEELNDDVKVVIGGAATSNQFAEKIGADAYCENVFEVNDILKSLKDYTGFTNV